MQGKAHEAQKEGKSYFESAKEQASKLMGQSQDKAGEKKEEAKGMFSDAADKTEKHADEAKKESKGACAYAFQLSSHHAASLLCDCNVAALYRRRASIADPLLIFLLPMCCIATSVHLFYFLYS